MSNQEKHDSKSDIAEIRSALVGVDVRLSKVERSVDEEEEQERQHNRSQLVTNKWIARFTGLLFFTSTVANVILLVQTQAAKRSADAAVLAASGYRTLQRPYVTANPRYSFFVGDKPLVFSKSSSKATVWDVHFAVNIVNTGLTPAVKVVTTKSRAIIGPYASALKQSKEYTPEYLAGDEGTVLVAHPTDVVQTTVRTDPVSVTDAEFQHLKFDRSWVMYVVGEIHYWDLFTPVLPQPYEMRYCFVYSPSGMPFTNCEFGNWLK